MSCYEYQEMTPEEFETARQKLPVFLVPLGLLEWHGNHLPLGTDILKAQAICLRIAKQMQSGIVLPPIYCGRPGFSSYTGTLTFSESIVNGILYELMGQLKKVGAKVIVLLTGHYGPLQETCVKRVAECFAKENPDIRVIALAEYENVTVLNETPADHAGKWETSLMRATYPSLTSDVIDKDAPLQVEQYENPAHFYYKENSNWTWSNDVTAATPQLGEQALTEIIKNIILQIKIALDEIGL